MASCRPCLSSGSTYIARHLPYEGANTFSSRLSLTSLASALVVQPATRNIILIDLAAGLGVERCINVAAGHKLDERRERQKHDALAHTRASVQDVRTHLGHACWEP
jgi:hypothetical protein